MRLVVDTSIIISSLMKDSESRRLMLLPDLDLFTPEYVHVEIERHAGKIMGYTGLSDNEYNLLMGNLLSHVNVIHFDHVEILPGSGFLEYLHVWDQSWSIPNFRELSYRPICYIQGLSLYLVVGPDPIFSMRFILISSSTIRITVPLDIPILLDISEEELSP